MGLGGDPEMKKAAKDKAVYAFVRRGDMLAPEMDYDRAALEGIAQGQRVRLSIEHWRNLDRLRAYWATLQEVVRATECCATAETLHNVIKLETGLVNVVKLPGGPMIKVPASIAIESLSEPDMIAFFKSAERYLAETFGWVPERSPA